MKNLSTLNNKITRTGLGIGIATSLLALSACSGSGSKPQSDTFEIKNGSYTLSQQNGQNTQPTPPESLTLTASQCFDNPKTISYGGDQPIQYKSKNENCTGIITLGPNDIENISIKDGKISQTGDAITKQLTRAKLLSGYTLTGVSVINSGKGLKFTYKLPDDIKQIWAIINPSSQMVVTSKVSSCFGYSKNINTKRTPLDLLLDGTCTGSFQEGDDLFDLKFSNGIPNIPYGSDLSWDPDSHTLTFGKSGGFVAWKTDSSLWKSEPVNISKDEKTATIYPGRVSSVKSFNEPALITATFDFSQGDLARTHSLNEKFYLVNRKASDPYCDANTSTPCDEIDLFELNSVWALQSTLHEVDSKHSGWRSGYTKNASVEKPKHILKAGSISESSTLYPVSVGTVNLDLTLPFTVTAIFDYYDDEILLTYYQPMTYPSSLFANYTIGGKTPLPPMQKGSNITPDQIGKLFSQLKNPKNEWTLESSFTGKKTLADKIHIPGSEAYSSPPAAATLLATPDANLHYTLSHVLEEKQSSTEG